MSLFRSAFLSKCLNPRELPIKKLEFPHSVDFGVATTNCQGSRHSWVAIPLFKIEIPSCWAAIAHLLGLLGVDLDHSFGPQPRTSPSPPIPSSPPRFRPSSRGEGSGELRRHRGHFSQDHLPGAPVDGHHLALLAPVCRAARVARVARWPGVLWRAGGAGRPIRCGRAKERHFLGDWSKNTKKQR